MYRLMRRAAVAAGAAAALTAVAPAGAGAKAPLHKEIRFFVFLKGSQTTTWHTEACGSVGGCRSAVIGDGDQMIRFSAQEPASVYVESDGQAAPEFSHGITVDADVERGAEYRERVPVLDPRTRKCRGMRVVGPTAMPGCGARSGEISVRLGYTAESVGGNPPDEELVPLSAPSQLRFRGINPDFGGGTLLGAYPQCPLQEPDMDYPATRGELFEAIGHLSEKRLLSVRRGGAITLSASNVTKFKLPTGGYGQTAVAYNLKLRAISVRVTKNDTRA